MRSFLVEFTKYLLVIHALVSVLDDHHEKEYSSINGRVLVIYMMLLLGFSLKVFWMQLGYRRFLIVWMTTMDESCKLEPPSVALLSLYRLCYCWFNLWCLSIGCG